MAGRVGNYNSKKEKKDYSQDKKKAQHHKAAGREVQNRVHIQPKSNIPCGVVVKNLMDDGKRAVAWSRQRGIQNGHGRKNAKGKGAEGGTQFSRLRGRRNGRYFTKKRVVVNKSRRV